MIDRFRLSSLLPRKLEELGLVPGDVLRLAGLPPGLFQAERIQVTTEELFAFYRGLAQAGGDPAIGLKLGTENRLERYSAVALAAVSSRSLRDSLERLARYKQLTCPEAVEVSERGDEGRVRLPSSNGRARLPANGAPGMARRHSHCRPGFEDTPDEEGDT